ncbi:MAG: hypothetical protein DMG39_27505 [Acidobacteria bacterium]|nr:MAG: hypothetical protein DMG39_27505 [Acidobacteriota bacterium]
MSPHRIAVLLDTSGAVLGQPDAEEWVAANTIALHIAQAPPQNSSLALLLFSDKVNEQLDFSKGALAVAKRLAEIRGNEAYAQEYLHGKTAPRDAILSAMRLVGAPTFSDSILRHWRRRGQSEQKRFSCRPRCLGEQRRALVHFDAEFREYRRHERLGPAVR